MKRCTKCGETKSEDEFHRKRGGADGRDSRCRKCRAEKDRRYREENREALCEKDRRYREENREAVRKSVKWYRDERLRVSKKYATKSGRFSPEEDLEVVRTDMTILEIAIALGRTNKSVADRRNRLRKKEKTNV